jgi:site-specific recombinase XerD
MLRVDAPRTTRKIKPVLAAAQMTALLRECEGNDFEARRDMAVVRILIDSGVRVSGLGNVLLENVDLTHKTIKIKLKEGDEHLIPGA